MNTRIKPAALAIAAILLFASQSMAASGWDDSQERQVLAGLSETFKSVARHAIPRTVCIRIAVGENTGFGSGAIVSPEGHILTCAHVSEAGNALTVITSDGIEHKARKLGANSKNDYSMIKIEGGPFPYFELGTSRRLNLGDWVIALGHPGGPYADSRPSVAAGRVTGLNRKLPVQLNVKYYDDAVQTDAPIFAGNSGGPLIDLSGALVGINGAILLINDNAYATPIAEAAADLEAMKAGIDVPGRSPENMWKVMQELTSEIDPQDLEKMFGKTQLGKLIGPALKMLSGAKNDREAEIARAERRSRMERFGRSHGLEISFSALGARVSRSVVEVFAGGRRAGFGVVIGPGLALTNDRILGFPAVEAAVAAGGLRRRADVVGRDGNLDVALLSFDQSGMPVEEAEPGDSDSLEPGDWLVSFGPGVSPVAVGVLSANNRPVGRDRKVPTMGIMGMLGKPNESPLREYARVMQHDSKVVDGLFGSPVFDVEGRLVGINVANFYRGSSYAAPMAAILPALDALKAGKSVAPPPFLEPQMQGGDQAGGFGDMMGKMKEMMEKFLRGGGGEEQAPAGWLGITGSDNDGGGVLVAEVPEGGPAALAGVKPGDVLVVFNNRKVSGMEELRAAVAALEPGRKVLVMVERDGKRTRLTVTLGKRPR